MAKRTCKCLNIILNISQSEVEEVSAKEVLGLKENDDLLSDDSLSDAFFRGTLMLVKLAMAGIEVVSAYIFAMLLYKISVYFALYERSEQASYKRDCVRKSFTHFKCLLSSRSQEVAKNNEMFQLVKRWKLVIYQEPKHIEATQKLPFSLVGE